MQSPSMSGHACTASLVLTNIRQYLDIIEQDIQRQDIDSERLQGFAAQLELDATALAYHARQMNDPDSA